jgi:hypothetical protein
MPEQGAVLHRCTGGGYIIRASDKKVAQEADKDKPKDQDKK